MNKLIVIHGLTAVEEFEDNYFNEAEDWDIRIHTFRNADEKIGFINGMQSINPDEYSIMTVEEYKNIFGAKPY